MIDALVELPEPLRRRLASALETEALAAPYTETAVAAALGTGADAGVVLAALREMEARGVRDRGMASWLRALEQIAAKQRLPDLVWSGPNVYGVHARATRQVYNELLNSANRRIWVSTYVYFDGPRAFETLAARMNAIPDLDVLLLLNIRRRAGDTASVDEIVHAFADRFWKTDWPGTRRPRVFYDPRSLDEARPGGVMHAKAVVVDDEAVFVTSANLTEAALDSNIELGLLVRERTLALSVARHFQALIDQNRLAMLPAVLSR